MGVFMNFKEIIVTKIDGITKITLNRPDKLNAWTTVMGNEVKAIEIAGQGVSMYCGHWSRRGILCRRRYG